jgi:hypothetical protein
VILDTVHVCGVGAGVSHDDGQDFNRGYRPDWAESLGKRNVFGACFLRDV